MGCSCKEPCTVKLQPCGHLNPCLVCSSIAVETCPTCGERVVSIDEEMPPDLSQQAVSFKHRGRSYRLKPRKEISKLIADVLLLDQVSMKLLVDGKAFQHKEANNALDHARSKGKIVTIIGTPKTSMDEFRHFERARRIDELRLTVQTKVHQAIGWMIEFVKVIFLFFTSLIRPPVAPAANEANIMHEE